MNIFFLEKDPEICASYHCDKHVVKMIVESCQMLSTVLRSKGFNNDFLYKSCFQNHPCTLWTGMNDSNFEYLLKLSYFLCKEYSVRYKGIHKSFVIVLKIMKLFKKIDNSQLTVPRLVMPEDCKINNGQTFNDCVNSYIQYYLVYKTFAVYRYTQKPYFYQNANSI